VRALPVLGHEINPEHFLVIFMVKPEEKAQSRIDQCEAAVLAGSRRARVVRPKDSFT
jgi:hypothetical protein